MNSDSLPSKQINDLELTALLPSDMVQSQKQLVAWCKDKVQLTEFEAAELEEAAETAKKNGWKLGVLKRHAVAARGRVVYYQKVLSALEMGYYIVPNFPVELFAIRTEKGKPLKMITSSRWHGHAQDAEFLPEGEGEYKNPFPIVRQKEWVVEGKDHYRAWAEDWDDMEFPITMAKPAIMDVTTEAMKQKIFDDFGIFPGVRKKQDPVIIGRIRRRQGIDIRVVSFMIAWHLNTNVL